MKQDIFIYNILLFKKKNVVTVLFIYIYIYIYIYIIYLNNTFKLFLDLLLDIEKYYLCIYSLHNTKLLQF